MAMTEADLELLRGIDDLSLLKMRNHLASVPPDWVVTISAFEMLRLVAAILEARKT